MKKRIISLLLALVLCLSLIPAAAASSDTSGHWAADTIADWQQKGYISGYADGSFRPNSSITRAAFIKIMNRVLGLTAEASISFSDVRESDWFYAEIAKAVAAGYAKGNTDGTFRPNAPITRAEAAAMLARAFKLTENEARAAQFTDADSIPAWAKGSVGAVAEAGYMTGYPDGSFGASGNITRAEAVVTADRAERAAAESSTKKPASSGSTSSGGAVTPPAQKTSVTGVQPVADVMVDYGTSETDAIAKLPQKVTLTCADGTTTEAAVTWTLVANSNYNATPDTTTDYTATGTVAIPDGYTYDGTLTATAKLSVRGADKTVKSIVEPDGIEVNYDTSETDAMKRLSTEATLQLYKGGMTFGNVTWARKSGETYNATPTGTAAVMTYTGTVTIPDGYVYENDPTSKTVTIETTITVVLAGVEAQKKVVDGTQPNHEVYIDYVYCGNPGSELRQYLPTTIRLLCKDGSPITVKVTDSNGWNFLNPGSAGESRYIFYYENITPPDGYALESEPTTVYAYIYIKGRDDSGLKAAIAALKELQDKFTADELEALEDPNKIYQASSTTKPENVAEGVRFVTENIIAELNRNITDAEKCSGTEKTSQSEIDAQTTALTNLKVKIDALEKQIGTGFTNASILYNVKEALKTKAAWLTTDEPLKAENQYQLPLTLTDVVTDANGGKSTVTLAWSCENSNITISNGSVTVTAPNVPQNITFTAAVSLGDKNIGNISFDAILGAPISVYTESTDEGGIPLLISGQKTEKFTVQIPLRGTGSSATDYPKIKAITGEITAAPTDSLLTVITETGVVSNPTDTALDPTTDRYFTILTVKMTATATQLAAVADTEKIETTMVTLEIPHDAITLTDEAKAAGWYIPQDKLELQGKVKIWHPLVTVDPSKVTNSNGTVTVPFSVQHLTDGATIQAALVDSTEGTFNGTGIDATYVNSTTDADGKNFKNYTTNFSDITSGSYAIWVKVAGTEWVKVRSDITIN